MGKEIERKFLVEGEAWRQRGTSVRIRQGYLSTDPERTVRVRVLGEHGKLTVKGKSSGIVRAEFEYDVPLEDAEAMLSLCLAPLLEKTRTTIAVGDVCWEVDEFFGENAGLVVAEVELASAEQRIVVPEWVGTEVSDDPRYYNANLLAHPYSRW